VWPPRRQTARWALSLLSVRARRLGCGGVVVRQLGSADRRLCLLTDEPGERRGLRELGSACWRRDTGANALVHTGSTGSGVASAPGKETAREETAPGRGKREKRKRKQAGGWFLEESPSEPGGVVHGAHSGGVLGHPSPSAPRGWALWELRCEDSAVGKGSVVGEGSCWLLVMLCRAQPWPIGLCSFSCFLLFAYSTRPSAWRREEAPLQCRLFPTTSSRSFGEPWPVAASAGVAAAGSCTPVTACPPRAVLCLAHVYRYDTRGHGGWHGVFLTCRATPSQQTLG